MCFYTFYIHQDKSTCIFTIHPTKALGKLGNIVVETFVILDVSSNVSLYLPIHGNIVAETKLGNASQEAKMFPSKFRNI
jgi:hypothetical protein